MRTLTKKVTAIAIAKISRFFPHRVFQKKAQYFVLFIGFAFIIFAFFIPISITVPLSSGEKNILRMSRWEAYCLDKTLRMLVCEDGWAYTLFGYKALSFGGEETFGSSLFSVLPSSCIIRFGWTVLHKVNAIYPQFLLWQEPAFWNKNMKFMFLANRTLLMQEKRNHSNFFLNLNVKDHNNCPVSLDGNSLQKNDEAFGVLLGYGHENSRKFSLGEQLKPVWEEQEVNSLYDDYSQKKLTFRSLSIENLLLPSFVADTTNEETKLLKTKYLKAREQIIAYYANKPFLETTLALLLDGPPDDRYNLGSIIKAEHLESAE